MIPKISIIIPVYNTEKYLRECLDSVVNQTLKEIEIVCIDDGSTDSSGAILDEYAEQDSRIRVLHKQNEGYGKGVNDGISLATGDYIGIVEPDDYIASDMYESLYSIAEQHGVDIVKADYVKFYGEKQTNERYIKVSEYDTSYNKVLVVKEQKDIFRSTIANWAGIYKRAYIEKYAIRHNETPGASYQDTGFYFLCHAYAETMYLLSKGLYYYRQDNMNSSVVSKSKIYCTCDEYEYIRQRLMQQGRLFYLSAEYQFKKMQGIVGFNISRIPRDVLKEYIYRLSDIYKKDDADGIFNLTMIPENDRMYIRMIKDMPEEFYHIYTTWVESIEKKISGFEKVILYGAGGFGKRILECVEGCQRDKIMGFAVSDTGENFRQYMGLPVRQIQEYASIKDECLVIVAVTKRYEQEIVDTLKKLEFRNISVIE